MLPIPSTEERALIETWLLLAQLREIAERREEHDREAVLAGMIERVCGMLREVRAERLRLAMSAP